MNTHYYDRGRGEVVKRPPRNEQKEKGRSAGRKQRNNDKRQGSYPREGLPISRQGRDPDWVIGYQVGYYQPSTSGGQMLGNEPKVMVSVRVDRRLLEQAIEAGINRTKAMEAGLRLALDRL